MNTAFCTEALKDATAVHGQPEIFNTAQAKQFASSALTQMPHGAGIRIARAGKICRIAREGVGRLINV